MIIHATTSMQFMSITIYHCWSLGINTLRLRQNGCHFASIFKFSFLLENFSISIEISLKFVPIGPINNKSALNQIMDWCQTNEGLVYWGIYASLSLKSLTLKRKGHQDDSPDIPWRRWRQASTSPVNIKAVNLTTFSFQCNKWFRPTKTVDVITGPCPTQLDCVDKRSHGALGPVSI